MSTLKGKLKVNYQDEYQVIHPESDVAQITDFAEGVRNVIPIPTHKVNTTYALGDIVYANNLPSWAYLECTTAGTTASTEPVGINTNVVIDTQITDGTVIWTVRKQGTPVASILRSLINTGIAQDQIPYGSGANSFAVTALTTLARTLLGQTTAAGMRETIDSAESSHSHSVGDITNFASEVIDAIGDETLSALGVHYSMTTNGYICFGELFGGLILQWIEGSYNKTAPTTKLTSISITNTYPITLNTRFVTVLGSMQDSIIGWGYLYDDHFSGTLKLEPNSWTGTYHYDIIVLGI